MSYKEYFLSLFVLAVALVSSRPGAVFGQKTAAANEGRSDLAAMPVIIKNDRPAGQCGEIQIARDKLMSIAEGRVEGDRREAVRRLDEFDRLAIDWISKNCLDTRRDLYPRSLTLGIGPTKITDPSGFAFLGGMPKLFGVTVVGPIISDEHIQWLSGKVSIEGLDIYDAPMTGAGMVGLDLPHLRCLCVQKCKLEDQHLIRASFPKLEILSVRDCSLTNKFVERTPMVWLKELFLEGTEVDEGVVRHLGRFPSLTTIGLDLAIFKNDEVISQINENKSLKSVAVRHADTEEDRAEIGRVRAKLKIRID